MRTLIPRMATVVGVCALGLATAIWFWGRDRGDVRSAWPIAYAYVRDQADGRVDVIVCVWSDGRVIWGNSRGGPPYQEGRIPMTRVSDLLRDVDRSGWFAPPFDDQSFVAPDSASIVIALHTGVRSVVYDSWHELYGGGKRSAVIGGTLVALEGKTREEAIEDFRRDSPREWAEYEAFLKRWDYLRAKLAGLVPSQGEVVRVEFRRSLVPVLQMAPVKER